jgi:hypothetical protein
LLLIIFDKRAESTKLLQETVLLRNDHQIVLRLWEALDSDDKRELPRAVAYLLSACYFRADEL